MYVGGTKKVEKKDIMRNNPTSRKGGIGEYELFNKGGAFGFDACDTMLARKLVTI